MKKITCWCKNDSLAFFSSDYLLCKECNTLVSQISLNQKSEKSRVKNDDEDFYGKNYWLQHQIQNLGNPDIFKRSRLDLTERCLFWLRALLKYKLPPATTLELGCSHGGFVALLKLCGFSATGLEMSPWIAEYAHHTFDIPILTGPIEQQNIPHASQDIIILMDVLEHLPHPVETMRHCLTLLKPNGILLIQTPNYPIGKTYENMVSEQNPFLQMLNPGEHLYLFSDEAVKKFLQSLTDESIYIQFEPAIFAIYDMFMVVSKQPIKSFSNEEIEQCLSSASNKRIIQGLLDLYNFQEAVLKHRQYIETDRAEQLKIIDQMNNKLNKQNDILNKKPIKILKRLGVI